MTLHHMPVKHAAQHHEGFEHADVTCFAADPCPCCALLVCNLQASCLGNQGTLLGPTIPTCDVRDARGQSLDVMSSTIFGAHAILHKDKKSMRSPC